MLPIKANYGVIMFYDKTKKFVNKEQYFKIIELSGMPNVKTFTLQGSLYSFTDIKKILTMQEYTDQYQDNETKYGLFDAEKYIQNKTPENRKRALTSMIKGIKDYIASSRYQGMENPKTLLNKMELKLAESK